jgi:hypothetical protein
VQGALRRAPASLAPGEDFSQLLCFSEEAAGELAAAARRRTLARRTHGGGARASVTGAGAGARASSTGRLGGEGVEEWCAQQEAVVLVNEGQFVAFPPEARTAAGAGALTARRITSVAA